jgi:hypothetical protein
VKSGGRPTMVDGSRRRLRRRAWALGALVAALATVALGLSCAPQLSDACDELRTCSPVDAGPVDAGDGRGASAMMDGVADVAMDGGCDPTKDPKDEPCLLDNAYGVFVASPMGLDEGTDAGEGGVDSGSGDGSMSQPYATIGQAMANLGSKTRIYICDGLYSEQVNVTAAVSLFGGLSCAAGVWAYEVGGSAQVSSPSAGVALSVTGVSSGSVTIEDLSFTSASATAPGGSSIAAWIASSSLVTLQRVTLSAGSGANGADGSTATNYVGSAPAGGPQVWSDTSGLFGAISGGPGASNQCVLSGSSAGGQGGLGCSASPGSPGLGTAGTAIPEPPVTLPGRDGLPMGTVAAVDGGAAVTVAANDPGADGLAGDGGVAAPAQAYGTLSLSGWTSQAGGDGANGDPGQGGAGATDPLYGRCGTPAQSLGGGGGGAGGCGGSGGQGGGGGGASIALAVVAGTVDLKDCVLGTAAAGTGGAGGAGQDGQAGGPGGDASFGSNPHAPGATGGNGAGGSGGAGGTGGISVGILSTGSTITSDTASQSPTLGSSGAGGAAGASGRHAVLTTGTDGNPGAAGSPGTSVSVLSLM